MKLGIWRDNFCLQSLHELGELSQCPKYNDSTINIVHVFLLLLLLLLIVIIDILHTCTKCRMI